MRERPLTILRLDNLGLFYPLIAELGLTNIAAAFEGGTTVRHPISPVPSVTESAEVVVKAGCGIDRLFGTPYPPHKREGEEDSL